MAGNRSLPFLGRYHHAIWRGRSVGTCCIVGVEAFRLRVHETLDPAAADRLRDLGGVGILRARKTVAAVEDDDRVVSRQGDCILNGCIARADYDDSLSAQRFR